MKAVIYEQFQQTPLLSQVKDPSPSNQGAIVKVKASGVCRSDWHGWMGHDPDIQLPHVPGHELAGTIEAVGNQVTRWKIGDRVTVPFIAGCGRCAECASGNQQVCGAQTQPGFTHWGSFAEYVSVDQVDTNLVTLPESIDFITAASLGCRFATAFRAIVAQGKVAAGQWVAVHGCGGVGLSAIMIAHALGARVIAIDIQANKLELAKKLGALHTIDATQVDNVVESIMSVSKGGVHLSLDALGSIQTCTNSIAGLTTRGTHVQVGLMVGEHSFPSISMNRIMSKELTIIGSHGMQAHAYPAMMAMIETGQLKPQALIGQRISLSQSIDALTSMNQFQALGVTVIDSI